VVHVFLARDSDSNEEILIENAERANSYRLQQQVDSEEWRNQTRAGSVRPRFEKQLYGGDVVAQVLVKHTKDLTVVSRCQKCNRSRSFTFDERHTTKTECNFTNLYRVDVGVFVDETMVAAL